MAECLVTKDRPKALDGALMDHLASALRKADADQQIRNVMLAGSA
jgi:enoyl-CoA hydratase/carnithine racemase